MRIKQARLKLFWPIFCLAVSWHCHAQTTDESDALQHIMGPSDITAEPSILGGEDLGSKLGTPAKNANTQTINTQTIKGRQSNPSNGGSTSQPTVSATQKKPESSEFQKFVQESTGKFLPVFGADFFENPGSYAPMQVAPVPNDYPLGPGDEVLIRGWGAVDIDYRAVIDRNGLINIPKVGSVPLAGVRAANAEEVIHAAIGKYYKGFNLNVTLGQLHGMTVYVVGQALNPGTYNVSSLSTLVTALFESGGPNSNGSLRRVQVKRAGKQIAEMDLYAFLSKGDKSGDVKLIDGDVIVIPPAYGHVALTGEVETPAIFELKNKDDTIRSLLEVAGGLPVLANPRRAFLEHVDSSKQLPRSVEEFSLDEAGLDKTLKNGDLISILSISPEFANAVTLRGSINQAVRVPFHEGMRVTDLIPSKEFLITRAVIRRQNQSLIAQERLEDQIRRQQLSREQAPNDRSQLTQNQIDQERRTFVDSVGNLYDDLNWDYAVVERINRTDVSDSLVPFNLAKALENPSGPDNIALQPGDTVTVFSAQDVRIPIAKRRVYVRVEGEVKRPGVYKVDQGETLVNVIEKAGGLTSDAFLFGAELYRDSVRKAQQENLDKYVRRLEQQSLSESSRLVANTSTADPQAAQLAQSRLAVEAEARKATLQRLRELKSSGRIALGLPQKDASFAQLPAIHPENNDRLVIPNRPDFVQVFGSVNTESALLWQPGRSVADYLAQSGVSRDADADATFVIRADGSVISNANRWFSSVNGAEVMPGDIIVVPEKLDKETAWTTFTRNAKDVTQILANFGIGAAAIHTLNRP